MMPTNLSDVHRDRRSTRIHNFTCDNRPWDVPQMLEAPLEVDYLTDDESDDGQEFEVPVPELDALIKGFEDGDDKIQSETEAFKTHLSDLKARGFSKETREEIKQRKLEKSALLDSNVTEQRRLLSAALPGMVEDLNQGVSQTNYKVYLR